MLGADKVPSGFPKAMRIHILSAQLFAGLGLALLSQGARAAFLPPDTTSKLEAYRLATNNMPANTSGTNKMILLIVSDTNTCTACRSLEFGILPTQQISNFLAESFVYWACGPEQACTEYKEYSGTGSLAIPMSYVINPFSGPGVYQFSSSGADSSGTYFEWLSKSLMRSTAPRVTAITYTSPTTVVVSGQSISTNVTLRSVRYRVNNGAWTNQTIPSGTWASAFQLPPLTVTEYSTNKLYVYGLDSSGTYKTKTNTVNLVWTAQKANPQVTMSAAPGGFTVYGQVVTFAAVFSGAIGTPTGTAQFKLNGVNAGPAVELANGTAILTLSTLAKGQSTVTVDYSGDVNYNSVTGVHTQTVNAAALTVTATGVNKEYDGTTCAQVHLIGNQFARDSITIAGTAAFTVKNAGIQSINVTGITVGGDSAANYQLDSGAVTTSAVIYKRPITVVAVADTKVADGTKLSSKIPAIVVGTLAIGDTAAFTQTFDSALVGSNKTITATGVVNDGNGGNNYEVTFVAITNGIIEAVQASPPTVSVAPSNQIVSSGAPVTFIGTIANGTGDEALQWRKDGVALVGKTEKTLAIGSVTRADAGAYQLVATRGGAESSSAAAGLWVTESARLYMALPVYGPARQAIFLQTSENLTPGGVVWHSVTNAGVVGLGPQVVVSEEYAPTNIHRFYRLFIPH